MPVLYRGYRGHVLQKYPLEAEALVVGRDASCDIILKGTGVSRRHCRLTKAADGYYVEDLASSNGTLINGARAGGRQLLRDGDKIVLMGHILTYRIADEVLEVPFRPPGGARGASGEESVPTEKLDPAELRRRLHRLLDDEFERHGDGGQT